MARFGGAEKQRVSVVLVCTVCGTRNYKTTKARRDQGEPLTLKKFCRTCAGHTVHIETK